MRFTGADVVRAVTIPIDAGAAPRLGKPTQSPKTNIERIGPTASLPTRRSIIARRADTAVPRGDRANPRRVRSGRSPWRRSARTGTARNMHVKLRPGGA
jgi:hypothetical protein